MGVDNGHDHASRVHSFLEQVLGDHHLPDHASAQSILGLDDAYLAAAYCRSSLLNSIGPLWTDLGFAVGDKNGIDSPRPLCATRDANWDLT